MDTQEEVEELMTEPESSISSDSFEETVFEMFEIYTMIYVFTFFLSVRTN